MATRSSDQLAFDEKVIENRDLERLLDRRSAAKDQAAAANAEARKADEAARAAIEALDIGTDAAVRVGRYRITKTMTEARTVSFDVEAKERVSIGLVE